MTQPDPDKLADFLAGGWAGMADAPAVAQAMTADQMQAAYDIAVMVRRGISAELLAHLREKTIEQPCFVPGMGGTDSAYQGFLREGQNSLVRYIEQQLAIAERGPPNAGSPQPNTRKPATAKGGK